MGSMSYQEKWLYGTLAVDLIVYVPYFVFLRHRDIHSLAHVIWIVMVVQFLVQSVMKAVARNRRIDERDKLIELSGFRVGYFTIWGLVALLLYRLWLLATFGPLDLQQLLIHFLNMLLLILVLSNVVMTVTQLVMYRRAA